MSYATIVVGKDCPTSRLITTLRKSPSFGEFHSNWSDLARELETPYGQILTLRRDQLVSKLNLTDTLHEIIEEWVARQGSAASLQKLVSAIEAVGMSNCADCLRIQFAPPCALRGSLRGTLPHRLAYYVNRTVVTRNIISDMVFERKSSDILLFTGMERYELSELVQGTTFSSEEELSSGTQIREGSTGILDQPHHLHFQEISEKTDHPVHWLYREGGGKLRWVRSSGGMATIQGFIDDEQEQIKEEEFPSKVSSTYNLPICISDSPGMGKSVLLSEVGRRLRDLYPDKVVVFVVAREFVQLVKQSRATDTMSRVTEALNNIGVGNPQQTAKVSTIGFKLTTELLIDGFDEVDGTDTKLAHQILRTLKISHQQIRLWVTSRPHFLHDLENTLGTLGYNIQPFSKDDQANFLASFWSGMGTNIQEQKLMKFALKCLENLKETLRSGEHDIAGIPLQCLLIGEVFASKALHYAQANDSSTYPVGEIGIQSVTSLYQLLIANKIRQYQNLSLGGNLTEKAIMDMHAQLSLKLLFPTEFPKLRILFAPIQLQDILRIGLLETDGKEALRFIHRTFAEYFVAWYVFGRLQDGAHHWNRSISEFLIKSFLQRQSVYDWTYQLDYITSYQFRNHTMASFLNSQLSGCPIIQHDMHSLFLESTSNDPLVPEQIAYACVRGDLLHLFNFFRGMGLYRDYENKLFDRKLILFSIAKSRHLVQPCFMLFSKHHNFDSDMQTEALRLTAYKGEFSTMEFLLKEKGLCKTVAELKDNTKWLLFDCLKHSNQNTERQIENKIQIIRRLVKIQPELLEVKDKNGRTPLLTVNYGSVHVRLLNELMRAGSNILATDIGNDTLLHIITDMGSDQECRSLILNIPFENVEKMDLRSLVCMKNEKGKLPIFRLLERHDLSSATLDIFVTAGMDFTTEMFNNYSVLAFAVKKLRNGNTIRKLVELSGHTCLGWRGKEGITLLHLAAQVGNLEAIQLFLELGEIDVNSRNESGLTPMDFVFEGGERAANANAIGTLSALHKRGGKFGKKFILEAHGKLLYCGPQIKLQLLKLLLDLQLVDINERDEHGNTLHHRIVDKMYATQSKDVSYRDVIKLLDINSATVNALNEKVYHVALQNDWMGVEDVRLLDHTNREPRTPTEFVLLLKCVIRGAWNLDRTCFLSLVDRCLAQGNSSETNEIYTDKDGKSMMHLAVENEDFETVKKLRHVRGSGIHTTTSRGYTPLHYAAFVRNKNVSLAIIQCLIDSGVDIYARDNSGFTFLHLFITLSRPTPPQFHGLVTCLLKSCGSSSLAKLFNLKCGPNSTTPLLEAVFQLEIDQGTLLILHFNGVNFNAVDIEGNTIITYAAWGKRRDPNLLSLSILTQFGDADQYDVTRKDADADYFLSWRLDRNEEKLVQTLIYRMAVPLQEWKYTPLHYATLTSNTKFAIKTIKILIANGADVYAKDNWDRTFLHLFIANSSPSTMELHAIAKMLVDVNSSNLFNIPGGRNKATALLEAILKTEMTGRTLSLLVHNEVDFHAVDRDGNSVWTYAVRGRRSETFMQFLAAIPGIIQK